VITLDLDTQLPRDAGRRLVGAMAHPLNRAVVDPVPTWFEGYGFYSRAWISASTRRTGRGSRPSFPRMRALISTPRRVRRVPDLFGEGSFTEKEFMK